MAHNNTTIFQPSHTLVKDRHQGCLDFNLNGFPSENDSNHDSHPALSTISALTDARVAGPIAEKPARIKGVPNWTDIKHLRFVQWHTILRPPQGSMQAFFEPTAFVQTQRKHWYQVVACGQSLHTPDKGERKPAPHLPLFFPGIFHPQTFQHILFTHRLLAHKFLAKYF